jgi:hypothetical protein
VSIGTESDGPAAFGLIKRAVLDDSGYVYFADNASHQIRSFRTTGEFVALTGRPGRGPGDFEQLSGLAHDGRATLYAADAANGLSIYETVKGAPKLLARVFNDKFPQAVCVSNGDAVVLANVDKKLLHRISKTGKILASFGDQLGSDREPQIQDALMWRGGAMLHCDETGAIYVTQETFGDIRKYSTNGSLQWKMTLPEFLGHEVKFDPRNKGTSVFWGRYRTMGVYTIGDKLIVQAVDATRSGTRQAGGGVRMNRDVKGIVTYVLSAANGAVVAKGYWSPLIVAVRNGLAVSTEEDPFPRARLLELSLK